jgi:hypothetical protein
MLPISLSVTLPAGRYIVFAKTFGDGSTSQAIGCYLRQRDAQNNIVDTVDFMWHNAFGAMIILESAVEIPAGGGAVSLDCRSERVDGTEGDPFPARTSKVVAIAVDAVN